MRSDQWQELKATPLRDIELIAYGANLCYHGRKIIRGETIVQNKEAKLKAITQEAFKYALFFEKVEKA